MRGFGVMMGHLWGDRAPALDEVRPILDLLVAAARQTAWHGALLEQARHVTGVSGTCWYADLVLDHSVPPVPARTPIPSSRLVSREGVTPAGSILLWLDEETGVIDCIEYSAIEMIDVDHYPLASEFEPDL